MALYDTAGNIISDAAVELGLGAVSDAFASIDVNVVQLRGLLKRLGRTLAMKREWVQLRPEHVFSTAIGVSTYLLPDGFMDMVDQSGWNRTTRREILPVSAQQWQLMKATVVAGTLNVTFLPEDGQIEIYPTPTAVESIAFSYRSRFWVRGEAGGDGDPFDQDAALLNSDSVGFDPSLMVAGLKLEFLKAKGFDTSAAQQDFDEAYKLVASANVNAAPVLSLAGGSGLFSERLMTDGNAPETGFGS